ncbi:MAG: type II toxin-antitoxin system RelE/ParE family toxin [Elusimicrobia bacterium]|nr:type II toxin-antitoxin system RelE/ParE family toxin [Elusimicrobiota bacterium]
MIYTLLYDANNIEKDLKTVASNQRNKILQRMNALTDNPRRNNVEKLTAGQGYRLRVGDYRVLFDIDDRSKTIIVYRIRHRKEAYR